MRVVAAADSHAKPVTTTEMMSEKLDTEVVHRADLSAAGYTEIVASYARACEEPFDELMASFAAL